MPSWWECACTPFAQGSPLAGVFCLGQGPPLPKHFCRGHRSRQGLAVDGEEADVPTAGAGCSLGRGLHGGAGYLMHPAAPRLPRENQPTHHPPPSLCPPLPRPYSVAISQEPLIPPSPLYRSPPSSPLFSILIILITLFASLSRRSNPSACAQADTQTFISSPPSARLAFFAPAFGGGKEKLAFLPWPVGQALPLSLALQGHFILPRRMGLIYLSPPPPCIHFK